MIKLLVGLYMTLFWLVYIIWVWVQWDREILLLITVVISVMHMVFRGTDPKALSG